MRRRPRVAYAACREPGEALEILRRLAPRSALIDIEPLVAAWNTDRAALDAGIAAFLAALGDEPGRIVFTTNSARTPSAPPGPAVRYVARAGKPLRPGPYRDLPRPGVVLGDQIATDGILAWRLGSTFVHYIPRAPASPIGTRLLRILGRPLRHLLFRPGEP